MRHSNGRIGNAGMQSMAGGGSLRLGWWLRHWLKYMEAGRGGANPALDTDGCVCGAAAGG